MTLSRARHALHHHRAQRRLNAEVRALGGEVARLKGVVSDRLNRALAAVAERDAWIHDDQYRARQWETWRAARARGDRQRGCPGCADPTAPCPIHAARRDVETGKGKR